MSLDLNLANVIQEKDYGDYLYRVITTEFNGDESSSVSNSEDLESLGIDPDNFTLEDIIRNWGKSGRMTVMNKSEVFCPGFSYSAGDAANYGVEEFAESPDYIGVKISDQVLDIYDYEQRGQRIQLYQAPIHYFEGVVVPEHRVGDVTEYIKEQISFIEEPEEFVYGDRKGLATTLENI